MITAIEYQTYMRRGRPRGLASVLRVAFRRFVAWRHHRAAIQTLRQLDDRMLKDIGLSRSDIVGAVYGQHVRDGQQAASVRSASPVEERRS
ncbi:MAG: DUF1127 domain-containing protein [Pseudomonadota bacterium]